MRTVVIMLIVALGAAVAVTSADADHWPADIWERLQRAGP